MKRSGFFVGLLVFVPVLAMTLAAPAKAKPDYLNRYEAGLQAIEREDWSRASELMQKALMERANEAGKLSQWFYWDPYVPHYYFGIARFHLNDCPQALRSWNSSEEQGVILDEEDLYSRMVELRDVCEARGAREARAGPGDSTEKRVRVADLAESGTRIADSAAPLVTSPEGQKRLQQTRTSLDVAKTTDEEAERISILADGSAPPALDRAINAYFSGDPGQALATLESFDVDAEGTHAKVKAHVHLLRAASAYRLYLLSAETDEGLRARAIRYARAFKAAGASVATPRSLFGPRFLDFLASVGS